MKSSLYPQSSPPVPISTGIPNLDQIIGGGIPRGGLVLIMGYPGSGKSTLAQQIAFAVAKHGEKVLILTAISEPTNKLIEHMGTFDFFDATLIGGPIMLLSLQIQSQNSWDSVHEQVLAAVGQTQPNLVILDGFRGLQNAKAEAHLASQFLYDVGTSLGSIGITTLITSENEPRAFMPESITADLLIGVHYLLDGLRQWRGVEVVKARGLAPMAGIHVLTIDRSGAHISFQLEEQLKLLQPAPFVQSTPNRLENVYVPSPETRAAFDLPELDTLLHGGIPTDSSTVLAGSTGTGKTMLSVQFALAGVKAQEPVVFLSFRETEEQLIKKMEPFAIGRTLYQSLREGRYLTHIHCRAVNVDADIIAERLIAEIERTGAKRVVIDSLSELERSVERGRDPSRLANYLTALVEVLNHYQVTCIMTKETGKIVASKLDFTDDPLSITVDNVLFLQQLTHQAKVVRVLSILKMRRSDYHNGLREFRIQAPEGIAVQPLAASTQEGLLAAV